MSGMRQIVLSG